MQSRAFFILVINIYLVVTLGLRFFTGTEYVAGQP